MLREGVGAAFPDRVLALVLVLAFFLFGLHVAVISGVSFRFFRSSRDRQPQHPPLLFHHRRLSKGRSPCVVTLFLSRTFGGGKPTWRGTHAHSSHTLPP